MPTRPPAHSHTFRGNPTPRTLKRCDPFYKTARWLDFRTAILAAHPLCADPWGDHARDGRAECATDVHHMIPRHKRPDLALAYENVQPLCHACHSRITMHETRI